MDLWIMMIMCYFFMTRFLPINVFNTINTRNTQFVFKCIKSSTIQISVKMIIDFVELPTAKICAIDRNGFLYLWAVKPNKQESIQPSFMHWFITQYRPISLNLIHDQLILIITTKQLIFTTVHSVQAYAEKYQHRDNQYSIKNGENPIKKGNVEKEQIILCRIGVENAAQEISYAQVISNSNIVDHLGNEEKEGSEMEEEREGGRSLGVVYGTRSGVVYYSILDIDQTVLISNVSVITKNALLVSFNDLQKQGEFSMEEQKISNINQNHEIKALIPFRDDSLLLIATAQPQIHVYNLVNRQIHDQLISGMNPQINLQPLKGLYYNQSQNRHKFYSIHSSYFIQWNFQLLQYEGCYKYSGIQHLCVTNTQMGINSQMIMAGNGPNICYEGLPVKKEKVPEVIQTSLQIITKIRELRGGIIGISGNYGMIELYMGWIRDRLLYSHQ